LLRVNWWAPLSSEPHRWLGGYAHLKAAFFRDNAGAPKQMQGVLSGQVGRTYVQIAELNADVPVKQFKVPAGVRQGATLPVWVAFSIQGPIAAFHEPREDDLLLP
jgi:hypothetical protein